MHSVTNNFFDLIKNDDFSMLYVKKQVHLKIFAARLGLKFHGSNFTESSKRVISIAILVHTLKKFELSRI